MPIVQVRKSEVHRGSVTCHSHTARKREKQYSKQSGSRVSALKDVEPETGKGKANWLWLHSKGQSRE